MKKIVIIGAGISGLSLAWHLQKRFQDQVEITLLEKSERAGGYLDSKTVNGHFFEVGPRYFKASKSSELFELIEDMGMSDEIIPSNKKSIRRYVYMNKTFHPIPTNPVSFLTSPLTKGLLFTFMKEYFKASKKVEDESIESFLKRRFGRSEKIQTLFNVFIQGIYAGDIQKLSMRSCFPRIFEWEQKYGSVMKGVFALMRGKEKKLNRQLSYIGLFRLKNGTKSLVDQLQSKINADLIFNEPVHQLQLKKNQVQIKTSSGKILADHVFICTPVKQASGLLAFLKSPELRFLSEIPRITLNAINLGFEKPLLEKNGFGYLIPSFEKEKALGCIWESNVYPQKNHRPDITRLTVMLGGAFHPDVGELSESKRVELARDTLKRHMNITEVPSAVCIGGAIDEMPLYHVGHAKKIKAVNEALLKECPQISLGGNYLTANSVNGCIERSKYLAQSLNFP